MKIKSITSNFKGIDTRIEPCALNIITGPYRSGKTTIIDAITAPCIGSIPRIGKSNKLLECLIGNGLTSAASIITFDDGTDRSFTISRSKDGVVSKKASKEQLNPVSFDPAAFLSCSASERVSMIQASVGVAGDPIAEFRKAIGRSDLWQLSKSKEIGEWIEETQADIKASIKALKAEKSRLESVIQDRALNSEDESKVEALRAELAGIPDDTSNRLNRELGGVLSELAAAQSKLSRTVGMTDERPSLTVDLLEKEVAAWKKEKAEKDLEAVRTIGEIRVVRRALEKIEEINSRIEARQLGSCSNCGATQEHWSKECGQIADLEKEKSSLAAHIIAVEDLGVKLDHIREDIATLHNGIEASEADLNIKNALAESAHLEDLIKILSNERVKLEMDIYEGQKMSIRRNELWAAIATSDASKKADEETRNRLDEVVTDLEGLDIAKEELDRKIASLSNKIMNPILEIANRVIQPIVERPLVSLNFNIGYMDGGHWIPLRAFCGTETAICMLGLQIAIAASSSGRIAVMDEFGIISAEAQAILCECLESMVEDGVLDQVFLAGSNVIEPEGWNIIRKQHEK